jgi:hypothetical protein
MVKHTLFYYIGIIGIAGKGPNYMELYNPDKTIGEMITILKTNGFSESNKRIEIFKFQKGNLNKYDKNNPHWSHETKLSECLNYYGPSGNDLMLIFILV